MSTLFDNLPKPVRTVRGERPKSSASANRLYDLLLGVGKDGLSHPEVEHHADCAALGELLALGIVKDEGGRVFAKSLRGGL